MNKNLNINYNVPDVLAFYEAMYTVGTMRLRNTTYWPYWIAQNGISQNSIHIQLCYIQSNSTGTFDGKKYKFTHNPINFTYNWSLSKVDIAAIRRMYPPEQTESGNGIKYARFDYSISGQKRTPFIHGWSDWARTFRAPSEKIIDIRNVTTRADLGYVKKMHTAVRSEWDNGHRSY